MSADVMVQCQCGGVSIRVSGAPIMSVECCCTTCREAGRRFEQLDGAPRVLTQLGNTPYLMYRKDRVVVEQGADALAAHRLAPEDRTRRVLATCCNSPMFLEFTSGHWLSMYTDRFPAQAQVPIAMRTMCRSVADGVTLPDDVPNPATHTPGFMLRLLGAWARMG